MTRGAAVQHMVLAQALLLQGKHEEAGAGEIADWYIAERSNVAGPVRQGLAAIRRASEAVSQGRVGGGAPTIYRPSD